ncbi:NAD(P)/FAD-dependent oxidoreductase [Sphingomonas sp. BK580]|uniref:flavin-containing monooxygenase n=1 Tax=Sphingomonas sp. BK580 TaxID=2586972 RepID=UPI001608501B|nr:NAD(P)/FAD-dependent oxidoreductase [Sphingomonas sp. BK580]MBB3692238.1 cation diffusion facilitator CzcD-associated flavoprotein CzcO [Sphingomonas sp. BK580]
MERYDVIIIGAGLSGIGAACQLRRRLPDQRFLILEARHAIGGTWDLFRYPGIRSDSDMHTLSYSFRPWRAAEAIADGPAIRAYIEETAREEGVAEHIRFGHRVTAAGWSSAESGWTLTIEREGAAPVSLACDWLHACTGYYSYDRAHRPAFAGEEAFAGTIVHPQFWPERLDYAGRRIAVIGSGATAVTLVPALARTAAHVTMVQRSPSYVVSRPARDRIADRLRKVLPERAAYAATRWKNVLLGQFFYRLARRRPRAVARRLIAMVRHELGAGYDVATHFTPRYDPWDQRLCLVPDGDLFAALRDGRASVATGTIDRLTRDGLLLLDGTHVEAEIVVTATGLDILLFGGLALSRNGTIIDPARSLQYKGMMLSDVPNFSFAFGYTNASWTLKADLVAAYLCRLRRTMRRRGAVSATPRVRLGSVTEVPFADLSSGYIRRALSSLPRQGHRRPWRLNQNYALDVLALRFGSVAEAVEFGADRSGTRMKR